MAHIDWQIRTIKLSTCGCLCEFDFADRDTFPIDVAYGPQGIVE